MRNQAQQYRDTVYRLKSHPTASSLPEGFTDRRDSMAIVYWSSFPFLILEYITEASLDLVISGLMFPTGFLLFWAFYYTYYRPGILEEKLQTPGTLGLDAVATVLFGVAIWFVKISVVGLLELILSSFGIRLKHARRSGTSAKVRRIQSASRAEPPPQPRPQPRTTARPVVSEARPLPPEVRFALKELGIETRDWEEIHRRYRELAKKFHPDHNTDRARAAQYFIRVDQAYRTLSRNKSQYFSKK